MRELLGQREVAQEGPLDFVTPREEMFSRSRKIAVTEPARALSARAVREHIDRVLRKCLAGRLEYLAVRRVLQRTLPRRVRVFVGPQLQLLDSRLPFQHDHLGELEGVGLERLEIVLARLLHIP